MRKILFLALCLFSVFATATETNPFISKQLLTSLRTKTIHAVFCDGIPTYRVQQTCNDLAASGETLNWKAPKIEILSSDSFSLTGDTMSVVVSKSTDPNEFEINHKKISLGNYTTTADLQNAIQNLLPRSAHYSVWINEAYAEDFANPQDQRIAMAAMMVMMAKSDVEMCTAANNFVPLCDEYTHSSNESSQLLDLVNKVAHRLSPALGTKDDLTAEAITSDEEKSFNSLISTWKTKLEILNKSIGLLTDKKDALMKCPLTKPTKESSNAYEALISCQQKVDKLVTLTETLPGNVILGLKAIPRMPGGQPVSSDAKPDKGPPTFTPIPKGPASR